jgi:hypothetical protein
MSLKKILSKIGGPAWRLVQTTTHASLGAAIVIWILIFVGLIWAVI